MKDHRRLISQVVSIAIGFALTAIAAGKSQYGWLLFVWIPFFIGFEAVFIYAWRKPRSLGSCLWMSLTPFAGICVLVLLWKIDGMICCLMAAPIVIPLGLIGGYVAWRMKSKSAEVTAACLLLLVAGGTLTGHRGPHPRTFMVTTSIVVNAPPDIVWHRVTDFPAIAEAPGALFKAGVAFPIRSDIAGVGLGEDRRCVLSTGTLDETVIAWNPPYLLRFRVNSTPSAMHELSPWHDIDPPHLHGFYVSRQGEFRLTELSGNRTLVEGTSWYSHGLEPAQYWRLWSDYVVHGVHRRVLEHIKKLAEGDNRQIRVDVAPPREAGAELPHSRPSL